jgi:hypothetical protein
VPLTVKSPDSYRHTVALFSFDAWIASLIDQQPFNAWNIGNGDAPVDELLFWAGDHMRIHAIPYEGQIYFDNLTPEEFQLLIMADKRIQSNLYPPTPEGR